jgi:hypothetical protein
VPYPTHPPVSTHTRSNTNTPTHTSALLPSPLSESSTDTKTLDTSNRHDSTSDTVPAPYLIVCTVHSFNKTRTLLKYSRTVFPLLLLCLLQCTHLNLHTLSTPFPDPDTSLYILSPFTNLLLFLSFISSRHHRLRSSVLSLLLYTRPTPVLGMPDHHRFAPYYRYYIPKQQSHPRHSHHLLQLHPPPPPDHSHHSTPPQHLHCSPRLNIFLLNIDGLTERKWTLTLTLARSHSAHILVLTETHLGPDQPPYIRRSSSQQLYISGPPKTGSDTHLGGLAVISLLDDYDLSPLPLPPSHHSIPHGHQILPCTVHHLPTGWKVNLLPTYSSPTSTSHNVQTLYDILDSLFSTNNTRSKPLPFLLLGDFNAYVGTEQETLASCPHPPPRSGDTNPIHQPSPQPSHLPTGRGRHLLDLFTSAYEAIMINLQSSPLPYTPPPPPHPGSTRILYNMNSLSDPRVPPALVSTLTAALPQFHHDFNTFDHLYTHNLLPLQAYLNHITDTVDTLLSTTAKSILGLRLPHPHKHHHPHNLHPPPTHTPEHTRARKTLHEDHQHPCLVKTVSPQPSRPTPTLRSRSYHHHPFPPTTTRLPLRQPRSTLQPSPFRLCPQPLLTPLFHQTHYPQTTPHKSPEKYLY